LLASGVTTRFDNALYDLHMRYWTYTPSGDVVIVAVDPRSIDALGPWPWPRSTHARVIDRLTDIGAGAIGTNVLIVTPSTDHPENDHLLAQAIRRHGRVATPLYVATNERGVPSEERLPIPEVASAAAAFGEVEVPLDDDGLARGSYLQAGLARPYWPFLPVATYQLDHPGPYVGLQGKRERLETRGESAGTWGRDDYVLIRYAGPAGTFRPVSYVDVLTGNADPRLLKGKTVLLGVIAPGIGDRFATPGMQSVAAMSAIEYMANVLESLRRGTLIAPLGFSRGFFFGMVALAFPLLIYGWPGFRRAWMVAAVSVAATLLASFFLLRLTYIWWPPVSVILIVIFGSTVWSVLEPRLGTGHRPGAPD
jgi:adenylate cyclase